MKKLISDIGSLLLAIAMTLGFGAVVSSQMPDHKPLKAETPVIIGEGSDIHTSSGSQRGFYVSDKLIAAGVNYAIGAGDFTANGTTSDFTAVQSSWGRLGSKMLPVPGNHETDGGNTTEAPYYAWVNGLGLPFSVSYNNGAWARDVGNGWRAYGIDWNTPHGSNSPQEVFVRNDIAAHPNMHRFLISHSPFQTSSTRHGRDNALVTIWNEIRAAGGEFSVNGHDHVAEVFARLNSSYGLDPTNGMRVFACSPSGTADNYEIGAPVTGSEFLESSANADNTVHYCIFKLSSGSYTVDTHTISNSGTGTDTIVHSVTQPTKDVGVPPGSTTTTSTSTTSSTSTTTTTIPSGSKTVEVHPTIFVGNPNGTVTSSPSGLAQTCKWNFTAVGTCAGVFTNGTNLGITMHPDAGSGILMWDPASPCAYQTGLTCTWTVAPGFVPPSDPVVYAPLVATTANGARLTVTKNGTGTGNVTSTAGLSTNYPINCANGVGACVAPITRDGHQIQLTATPTNSSTFTGWSGACTGTSPTCAFSASGSTPDNNTVLNLTATANFAASAPPPPTPVSCPSIALMATLSGAQSAQYRPGTIATGGGGKARIVADTATWNSQLPYPVTFGTVPGSCWQGGTFTGSWDPETTLWDTYHGTGAINLRNAPGGIVKNVTVNGYGDSLRVEEGSPAFLFDHDHVLMSHDDCFEDDHNWAGLIRNTLLESCYSGISMASSYDPTIASGRQRTLTLKDTIVNMSPMTAVYKPESHPSPGHGAWFKFDCATSPNVRLDHVVLGASMTPNHQSFDPPCGLKFCKNVTIDWYGNGASRQPLVFPNAAAWRSACPSVVIHDNDAAGALTDLGAAEGAWRAGTFGT